MSKFVDFDTAMASYLAIYDESRLRDSEEETKFDFCDHAFHALGRGADEFSAAFYEHFAHENAVNGSLSLYRDHWSQHAGKKKRFHPHDSFIDGLTLMDKPLEVLAELDASWMEAVIWFYSKCIETYTGDERHHYCYCRSPVDTSKISGYVRTELRSRGATWDIVVNKQKDFLDRAVAAWRNYQGQQDTPYNKAVECMTDIPFDGDVKAYVIRHDERELSDLVHICRACVEKANEVLQHQKSVA